MTLWYDEELKSYCIDNADEELVKELVQLRWTQFPNSNVWTTRNDYHAAPLWDHTNDAATQQRLNSFAYNYRTSFASEPLAGTGVDSLQVKPGAPTLFGFQTAGIQLATNRQKVLIGDDMGLGKSSQFINICNLKKPKRVLIACPTFLIYNWAAELEKWCSYEAPITLINKPNKSIPDRGFILLPYSRGFSYWQKLIASGPFDIVGLDEIHYLKGAESKRVKPFFGHTEKSTLTPFGMSKEIHYPGVIDYAGQVVGMTGTPVPNNPSDIFNLIQAMKPEMLGGMSRAEFNNIYCTSYEYRGEDMITGGSNEYALNTELRSSGLMIRRLKKDVLSQLPPKNRYLVQMEPTKKIEGLVKREAELYAMAKLRIFTAEELADIAGHIATVRRELAFEKAPKIYEYAKNVMDGGVNRLILFMWHTDAINEVADKFRKSSNRIKVHVVDGKVNLNLRQSAVEEFQSDSDVPQIFIGQIKAAGVGLTLTKANQVIMGEISWVPSDNAQAEDRAHRISQTEQVDIAILTYPHSVEAQVMSSAAKKEISSSAILDENLLQRLSELI